MSATPAPALATEARAHHLAGETTVARLKLMRLISDVTGLGVAQLAINTDQYSLNSLNGTVLLARGDWYFFKFHSEENDESTIQEYYNAELLREHGYPVDVPSYACGEPGRQILLYELRSDERLADVCRSLELGETKYDVDEVVSAQARHDDIVADRMIESLHSAELQQVAAEPIHQLFWNRLVGPGAEPGFGGRVERFYVGRDFALGGDAPVSLGWPEFRDARWVINGIAYGHTIGELFAEAAQTLHPERLASHGAVVAHGDAHNANVWFDTSDAEARLISFDPAFAGRHIPALLAEIKATFHNVYAHPFWLYEPGLAAERYGATVAYEDGLLVVDHDFEPGALRSRFLDAKVERLWLPLLDELRARDVLPPHWERIVRLALFCCPTLVLDLRAGGSNGHTPVTSAIGMSIAVAAGSGPVAGNDLFTPLFAPLT